MISVERIEKAIDDMTEDFKTAELPAKGFLPEKRQALIELTYEAQFRWVEELARVAFDDDLFLSIMARKVWLE